MMEICSVLLLLTSYFNLDISELIDFACNKKKNNPEGCESRFEHFD